MLGISATDPVKLCLVHMCTCLGVEGMDVLGVCELNSDSVDLKLFSAQIEAAQEKLRAFCEAEGLLLTYKDVHEYFLGKDAYSGYSLKDWLRDAKFRYEVLDGTLGYYRLSIVMAHIVRTKYKLQQGNASAVEKRLCKIESLMQELPSFLPEIYLDILAKEPNSARLGGNAKKLYRRCRSILKCLKTNHDLDGIDFKSFNESVAYAIEMVIHDEGVKNVKILKEWRKFYPYVFRRWLSVNPKSMALFEKYTGCQLDD